MPEQSRFKCTGFIVRLLLLLILQLILAPVAAQAKPLRYAPVEPHHDNVVAARFTADNGRIVSVDDSGVLIEWDFINKRILRRVEAPFNTQSAALSGNLAKAVFLGKEGQVVLYDLASGKFTDMEVFALKGQLKEDAFHTIAISDNTAAIFVSDGMGRLFRSLNGKPFTPFPLAGKSKGAKVFVTALSVSPDGKKLAIGEQGMIRIVDANSGDPVWLIPHDDISYSFNISFSPDSSLVTAGIPGVITLNHSQQELAFWKVAGGSKRLAVTSSDGVVTAGGFSRDGMLALLAFSSDARLYDLTSGKQLGNSFKATDKKAEIYFQIDMSPDGKYILISGRSGLLKVFEMAKIIADKEPQEFASLEGRSFKVEAMTFSPDGSSLLVSHEHVRPLVLDLKEQKMRERLEFGYKVDRFEFTKDGKKLLAIGSYFLGQWQWPQLAKLPELEFKTEARVAQTVIAPDGKSGVALTNHELIGNGFQSLPVLHMLDLDSGKITASFKLEELTDRNSRYFQLACVDLKARTAMVLDNDGDRRDENGRKPNPGRLPNRALLYSLADGKFLKSIMAESDENLSFDCISMKFAGAPRQSYSELEGGHHYNHLNSDRFSVISEDGLVKISDKIDGSVRLIETSGTNFTSWETGNHVITLAMSPDGSTLAVGTNKGDVGLYDVNREKWLGTFLYLAYKEWIWYMDKGIVNSSKGGAGLVRKKNVENMD
ncbi:MAG: WD40 repeat domain-containing protein [Geobacteraceae bacterium]|nr:WD40 repeat domain-containing protein [Geobacteraceae bacterium]